MSLAQRVAWLNLIVAGLAVLVYFALLPILGPWRAMGAFGLLGFSGVAALLYLREMWSGRVVVDERDQLISMKAIVVAKQLLWVSLVVAFLVGLLAYGEHGAISIQVLSMVLWWGFCGFLLVQSIVVLALYARQ
jgi:hypothetical protein